MILKIWPNPWLTALNYSYNSYGYHDNVLSLLKASRLLQWQVGDTAELGIRSQLENELFPTLPEAFLWFETAEICTQQVGAQLPIFFFYKCNGPGRQIRSPKSLWALLLQRKTIFLSIFTYFLNVCVFYQLYLINNIKIVLAIGSEITVKRWIRKEH